MRFLQAFLCPSVRPGWFKPLSVSGASGGGGPDHWSSSSATCGEIAFVNVGGYGNHIWIDNVTVGEFVGIESPDQTSDYISIYPNPSNGIFNVILKNKVEDVRYSVFNSVGAVVQTGNCEKSFQIDLADMPSGLYLLSIPGQPTKPMVIR